VLRSGSKLRTFIAVTSILLASLTLLSTSIHPSENRQGHWYESVFFEILSPFQRGVTYARVSIGSAFNRYVNLVHVAEENALLKKTKQQLETQVLAYRELIDQNNRLKKLLEFKATKPWKTIAARVIAHNPQAEFRLLTLNRGRKDGLTKRMPVIAPDGLVGQIYRLGRHTAQVLLLTDLTSSVDARLPDTGARGLIKGRVMTAQWDRRYFMTAIEYVDRKAKLTLGSVVLSSGFDGVFPAGIPIGIVHRVKENSYGIFQDAEVIPLVDFVALREVLVVTDW